jgi:steroid delta-isomerase-like uncharacterized protein
VTDAEKLVRSYIERVWNRGDLASLESLTTPDFGYHLGSQAPRDRHALGEFITATRVAFPDWTVEVEQTIVDGTKVAVRWRGRVTHLGPFRGLPPTGRTITVTGMNVYNIREGRVSAEWEQTDSLGMLQQLGVLPA